MENKKFLILLLVFAVLLAGAYVLYDRLGGDYAPEQLATQPGEMTPDESTGETTPDESASETVPAPDFTVYDLEGNPVRLSDFEGKPTVVNFWASWCGPCQSEMPDFQAKYQELGDQVHFLMINMTDGAQETLQTATDFLAKQSYTFPVYFDTDMDAAMTYGVYSLPTTYFIDAQGNVVAHASGAIHEQIIQKGIDMIR